jgi:hypothetical protein
MVLRNDGALGVKGNAQRPGETDPRGEPTLRGLHPVQLITGHAPQELRRHAPLAAHVTSRPHSERHVPQAGQVTRRRVAGGQDRQRTETGHRSDRERLFPRIIRFVHERAVGRRTEDLADPRRRRTLVTDDEDAHRASLAARDPHLREEAESDGPSGRR